MGHIWHRNKTRWWTAFPVSQHRGESGGQVSILDKKRKKKGPGDQTFWEVDEEYLQQALGLWLCSSVSAYIPQKPPRGLLKSAFVCVWFLQNWIAILNSLVGARTGPRLWNALVPHGFKGESTMVSHVLEGEPTIVSHGLEGEPTMVSHGLERESIRINSQ